MELKTFLDENKIMYKSIWYYLNEANKKVPIGEMNNLSIEKLQNELTNHGSKPKYIKRKGEKVFLTTQEYASLEKAYSVYLKYTNDLFCLDVDMPEIKSLNDLMNYNDEFKIFKGCSWVVGNTKGIHIYLNCINVPKYSSEIDLFKNIQGDFIKTKNNMWEKIDKKVQGKLRTFDFDNLKPLFKDEIFNLDQPKSKKSKNIKFTDDEKKHLKEFECAELTDIDKEVVKLLDRKKHFEDTQNWIKMCWIFKSVGFGFDVFDSLSKDVKGYDKESNKYYWDNQKVAKLNTGIIHYLARIDSPEEYDKLNAKNYFKKDNEIECTTISKRYLLPNNVKKITTKVKSTCEDDNDVVLQKKIKEFFKDDNIKSFNLKSPYDTGKTQMIKTIINTYNPKRILWLSYRKTLTNDILGNFEKEYDFKDYQENEFDADRLIIQLESILKIECERNMFQDSSDEVYFKYPEYDLVLVDEIESILSHFNSPTFKGNSKTCFNFINNILCNSTKVITLDGDMGNRTYKFIERFGNSINVVNDITFDTKKFIIDEKEEHFYNEIKKDLKQNKKIVVVSMSSKKCDELEKKLCEDFKETKKILVYTGSADDKLKADFKDVKTKWSNCDVLIYSPTCESGVNFDAVHFDKMYGIFSTLSTTPRAYFQMLSRVRKFASNEVLILDLCFSTETVNPNRNFFNFNEVKESVMLLDTITLETSDIIKDGKIYKTTQLSPYDTNYIYNRAEQLNASKQYWLSYFAKLAINKGHTVKYLKNKIKSKKDEEVKEPAKNALIEIPNITEKVFKELLKKQKQSEATKEEKLKIKKHALKFHLGLDELNEDVIKVFDVQSVTNFTSLIDVKNIKEHDDNQTLETIDKSKIVNKLIKEIGFQNIFDQKKRIDKETFLTTAKQIIETNDMFKNIKNTQIRFNISKEKKCNTNKAFLGFVNTILDKYFLKIQYFKSNNKVFYKLEQLNNINELLGYKILKGYELHDSKDIRTESTTEQYKSLVDFEEIERIKLEEEENNKGDNDDEENKKMKTKQRREYNKVHK